MLAGSRRKWLAVLGLPASADVAAVKKKYRELVKKHHPDIVGGDSQMLRSVVEAYEGLTAPSGGSSTERADVSRQDDPATSARWNVRRRMQSRLRDYPAWFYEDDEHKKS